MSLISFTTSCSLRQIAFEQRYLFKQVKTWFFGVTRLDDYDGLAASFPREEAGNFIVAAVAQCCRSTEENDRHGEKEDGPALPLSLDDTRIRGWSGGSGGGDLEFEVEVESSLVQLLVLS